MFDKRQAIMVFLFLLVLLTLSTFKFNLFHCMMVFRCFYLHSYSGCILTLSIQTGENPDSFFQKSTFLNSTLSFILSFSNIIILYLFLNTEPKCKVITRLYNNIYTDRSIIVYLSHVGSSNHQIVKIFQL